MAEFANMDKINNVINCANMGGLSVKLASVSKYVDLWESSPWKAVDPVFKEYYAKPAALRFINEHVESGDDKSCKWIASNDNYVKVKELVETTCLECELERIIRAVRTYEPSRILNFIENCSDDVFLGVITEDILDEIPDKLPITVHDVPTVDEFDPANRRKPSHAAKYELYLKKAVVIAYARRLFSFNSPARLFKCYNNVLYLIENDLSQLHSKCNDAEIVRSKAVALNFLLGYKGGFITRFKEHYGDDFINAYHI